MEFRILNFDGKKYSAGFSELSKNQLSKIKGGKRDSNGSCHNLELCSVTSNTGQCTNDSNCLDPRG